MIRLVLIGYGLLFFITGYSQSLPDIEVFFRQPQITRTIWEHHTYVLPNEDGIRNSRADFDAESTFPTNPEGNSGNFRFDYCIHQYTDMGLVNTDFRYYVNSRDGSMAFERAGLEAFGARLPNYPGFEFHFAVWKANGDMIFCGRHEEYGLIGVMGGRELNTTDVWMDNYLSQMQFLNSIDETPQPIEHAPSDEWARTITGYRGKVVTPQGEQFLKMYFHNIPSTMHTSIPLMGAGTGVFKNFKQYINQLLVYCIAEQVPVGAGRHQDVVFQLLGLYESNANFNTSPYQIMMFPTETNISSMAELSTWLVEKKRYISELQERRKDCPNDDDACREQLDLRIAEEEETIKRQVRAFAEKMGVPPAMLEKLN